MMPYVYPLTIMAAACAAAGLVLLAIGWRGRVAGTDRHCRKCRYNVSGAQSIRCPECGAHLTEATTRIGLHSRRGGMLAAGVVSLLLAAAFTSPLIYSSLRFVNWYNHLPDFAVMSLARRDDYLAIRQLTNRLARNELHTDTVDALTEQCFDHLEGAPTSSTVAWGNLAAALYQGNYLSGAQRVRLYEDISGVTYDVRPLVRYGDPIPARLERNAVLEDGMLGLHVACIRHELINPTEAELARWRSGPVPPPHQPGETAAFSFIGAETYGPALPAGGTATVVCFLQRRLHPEKSPAPDTALIWSSRAELHRTLKILPPDSPDPIRVLTALPEGVRPDWLHVDTCILRPALTGAFAELRFGSDHGDLPPFDFAGYLIAVVGDREFRLAQFEWKARRRFPRNLRFLPNTIDPEEADAFPDEARMILRPDRLMTAQTLDMFEMWHEDIELGSAAINASSWELFRERSRAPDASTAPELP